LAFVFTVLILLLISEMQFLKPWSWKSPGLDLSWASNYMYY